METHRDRGQSSVEAAIVLLFLAAIWINFTKVVELSRPALNRSTLSRELR